MKHLKDGALSYLFYLVGTFIFLIAVMTLDGSMTSPFSIRLSNILNYIDLGSLVFILAFCLLALACTKTMRPLKDAAQMLMKGRVNTSYVFYVSGAGLHRTAVKRVSIIYKSGCICGAHRGRHELCCADHQNAKEHGFRRGSFMGRVSHQYCYDFFGVFVGASYDFNANLCSFSAELVPCQTTRKDAEGSGVPQE